MAQYEVIDTTAEFRHRAERIIMAGSVAYALGVKDIMDQLAALHEGLVDQAIASRKEC